MKKLLFLLLTTLLFTSCISRKKIAYVQDYQNVTINQEVPSYEQIITYDDVLLIDVISDDPEITRGFNLETIGAANAANLGVDKSTFLVDKDGFIFMPSIGKIKVAGLTKIQLRELLEKKLESFIKNPIINIRLINFKVSVLGEVKNPGVVKINSDRLSLLDAIAAAGDLTIFGKRENIMVIREVNGVQTSQTIDITNSDFIKSPFYFLKQNDIVIVEPRSSRRDSGALGSNVATGLSIISILLTATLLFRRR